MRATPLSFTVFLLSAIGNQLTILACPSLVCFFKKGSAEGTSSLKKLCLMFVYAYFVLCV